MSSEEEPYQPKDALREGARGLLIVGGAGVTLSAIQNTLTKQNVGALGFITRTGGTAASFAALGGVFGFVTAASANLREKDDTLNPMIGGFFGGAAHGLRSLRIPIVLGYGAALAVLMGTFHYTGGSLRGTQKDPEIDEFERKQALRKNRRRPIEETISELGEGRGIYGPGYEERRRQRIKEKYGIDVAVQEPATPQI